MSGDKPLVRRQEDGGGEDRAKRVRYDRCFSGPEFSLESRPLKDLDKEKVKNEIKRWAKAVVAYARQLSGGFSSMTRQLSRSFNSRDRSGQVTDDTISTIDNL